MYFYIVGFGFKYLKFLLGLEVKIFKVICIMIVLRFIIVYVVYCQDNDIVFLLRVILYKIVKVCVVLQMKLLYGIDNFVSEGELGIFIIEKVVEKLFELGFDELKVKDFKN